MAEQKASNIVWHEHNVKREEREQLLKQKGAVLWFTGLPSSGKSTIANALARRLHEEGRLCYVLDGDNVRHGLNKDLGFSPQDREENIRRISEVAALFADSGVIATTAFVSPYRKDRDFCRQLLGPGRFFEVFVKTSVETCEDRDPKGLYKKARAGVIPEFTGISAPYEAPANPEITLDTEAMSVDEEVDFILDHLREQGVI
ncbi:MAG: adenylyl-sulfate kinase [Acidobacteriota bacterium]|jgi:adenylylsulfate kinase|nr:adenylyl-sulfate kinase [Acidobacteriota bacterium]